MPRAADRPCRTKMRKKFLLQNAPRLDEQASVDRLVGHAGGLVVGMGALQPACDLLRRPLALKLDRYSPAKRRATSQLAGLGTQGAVPRRLI